MAFTLGLIFLGTGLAKAYRPGPFLAHVEHHLGWPGKPLLLLVLAGEGVLAFSWLTGQFGGAFTWLPGVMLVAFSLHLLRLGLKRVVESCPCYGGFVKATPLQALRLNGVYLLFWAYVAWEGGGSSVPSVAMLIVSGAILPVLALSKMD